MKIVSFNVNGIRARLHQLEELIKKHNPDIIGVQETKVVDDSFPMKAINDMGYHCQIFGQKGHYGVAILSKQKPVKVQKGFATDEPASQRRLIAATYIDSDKNPFTVINGYFPQGESRDHPLKFPAKEKFYADLLEYLNQNFNQKDDFIILGDMNVAPGDLDVGIGEKNAKRWLKNGKCCFLPEEREWLQKLINWGTFDLYREQYPESNEFYSWFDYRSKGFDDNPKRGLRIDLLLGSQPVLKRCKQAGIDYEIRAMEKPSDHAPAWVVID
jgi:exodeoxyribonuclease-3